MTTTQQKNTLYIYINPECENAAIYHDDISQAADKFSGKYIDENGNIFQIVTVYDFADWLKIANTKSLYKIDTYRECLKGNNHIWLYNEQILGLKNLIMQVF